MKLCTELLYFTVLVETTFSERQKYYNTIFSVGMVSKPVAETAPEFQIQQEDFPALPGAQSKGGRGEREKEKKEREKNYYLTFISFMIAVIVHLV